MSQINDDSAKIISNCWAAQNHGLAVEIERRGAKEALQKGDDSATSTLQWFQSDFEVWLKQTFVSEQNAVSELVGELVLLCPPHCFLTAWRHLHDVVTAAQQSDQNKNNHRKWEALLFNIVDEWNALVKYWNRFSYAEKEAANGRYRALLEGVISRDFSTNRVSSQKMAGIADHIPICNEVANKLESALRRLRPVHLYAMVATLEQYRKIPEGKRQLLTSYLCEERGIKVRSNYVPDKSRKKHLDPNEPSDEGTLAVEATTEALLSLKLITREEAFRLPMLLPSKPKRTK